MLILLSTAGLEPATVLLLIDFKSIAFTEVSLFYDTSRTEEQMNLPTDRQARNRKSEKYFLSSIISYKIKLFENCSELHSLLQHSLFLVRLFVIQLAR